MRWRSLVGLVPLLATGCIVVLLAAGLVGVVAGAASSLLAPSFASTCDLEGTALPLDATAYEHTPQAVIDGLGTRSVDMVWYDRDGVRLTMDVATDATEVVTLTDDGCDGIVAMPVDVTLSSGDGRLDETFRSEARIRLDNAAWVLVIDHVIAVADLQGSLPLPALSEAEAFVSLGFQLRWNQNGTILGGIRGVVEEAGGDTRIMAIGLIGGSTQEEVEQIADGDEDLEDAGPVQAPAQR